MEGTCEHSDVCGRDALDGHDGKCILHSEIPNKDEEAFEEILEKHREENGPNFRRMVFPGKVDFSRVTFKTKARFSKATFKAEVEFHNATFEEGVRFRGATFESESHFTAVTFWPGTDLPSHIFASGTFVDAANFAGATFEAKAYFNGAGVVDKADFSEATFKSEAVFAGATFVARSESPFESVAYFLETRFETRAYFRNATFGTEVIFRRATFEGEAIFHEATFEAKTHFVEVGFNQADFEKAIFENEAAFKRSFTPQSDVRFVEAKFRDCQLNDDVSFSGEGKESRAFAGGEVDFQDVTVSPDASLHFRYADLSKCRFLRTDLRDVEFTGVQWCEKISSDGRYFNEWFERSGLYDEVYRQHQAEDSDRRPSNLRDSEDTAEWSDVERLYRQLKRNYEDRGDFPRAGDFHIGEKVARRQNPQTHWGMQFLLTVYRALSKYGERALPAAFWLLGLFFSCGIGYLWMGASTDAVHLSSFCSFQDWWEALILSGEATLFPVRSAGFESIGPRALNLMQRGFSPILIALLVLALRQRVKR